jgi:hypothetical protein
MKKKIASLLFLSAAALTMVWGCMGNKNNPLTPTKTASLNVSISNLSQVQSSLLGASSNEILYRIDGASSSPITGSTGPFSASGITGSYVFTIPAFAQTSSGLLSLQLNDANSHQALAIGAAPLPLAGNGTQLVTVDLGSITLLCYDVNGDLPALAYGYAFGFSSYLIDGDEEDTGAGRDIAFQTDESGFNIFDAISESYRDIAYLGNGNLVDYDRVPADSSFYVDSNDAKESVIGGSVSVSGLSTNTSHVSIHAKDLSPLYNLRTGDIFCLKLTSVPNAHAWIQITDPGLAGTKGPSFVYRINRTEPYYAYDPVNESLHCIGNASQISPIPTATATATITPTPAFTATPTPAVT